MKKLCSIVIAVIMGTASIAFAADQSAPAAPQQTATQTSSTPFQVGVWQGVWEWPLNSNVYGFSLGLPSTYSPANYYIVGLNVAILETSSNVKGMQIGLMSTGSKSDALQVAVANIVDTFAGVQIGVYNDYKNSAGLQIGVINKGESSKGFQLGLINMMDNGFFPTFPLINFSSK